MSNIFGLLSPDENADCFRVKQATKQGYILCGWGGYVIYHIRHQNFAEAECKTVAKSHPRFLQTIAIFTKLKGMKI